MISTILRAERAPDGLDLGASIYGAMGRPEEKFKDSKVASRRVERFAWAS